jgi:putative transposase
LTGRDDGLTLLAPALDRFPRFADLIEGEEREELQAALRRAETIGRPLGDAASLTRMETALGRTIRAQPRGPKPRPKERDENGELSGLSP